MTINDQIRNEKLQYDLNRETAKISALSSGKIHKYEYLTGEDILPSNQQQIIEQAKFTYSSLGKAFKKHIKAIKDHGEKQIKAIQDQGQLKTIKKYVYNTGDIPLILKQKEIFNGIVDERLKKQLIQIKKVNSDDLIYRYKSNSPDLTFDEFDNALALIDKIRNGKISLTDVKNNQEKLKSYLGEIQKMKHRKSKKTFCIILKRFIKQEMKPVNFMIIIL